MILNITHRVMEEEHAAKKAEEVGGEQSQVDGGSAGHLHHDGHEAVQRKHTQDVDGKQRGCRTRGTGFNWRRGFNESSTADLSVFLKTTNRCEGPILSQPPHEFPEQL